MIHQRECSSRYAIESFRACSISFSSTSGSQHWSRSEQNRLCNAERPPRTYSLASRAFFKGRNFNERVLIGEESGRRARRHLRTLTCTAESIDSQETRHV